MKTYDFREVRSLREGAYDHVLQPLQGGGEYIVTPLAAE